MDYVGFNEDEDLTQSIINWKQQWADVEQRTRARRRKLQTESSGKTSTGTLTPAMGSRAGSRLGASVVGGA